jgi:hypothetical protein
MCIYGPRIFFRHTLKKGTSKKQKAVSVDLPIRRTLGENPPIMPPPFANMMSVSGRSGREMDSKLTSTL